VNYYAHTAELPNGERDLDVSRWQLLSTHLRNVAELAKRFGGPLGLASEAELAGLLHDLGKYRDEFQAYLRGERARGAETHHAIYGAKWLFDKQQLGSAFGVAGHHAGLHDLSDLQSATNKSAPRFEEVVPKLQQRFAAEVGAFPKPPGCPSHATTEHAVEMYTRLLFSCLVDADRLDTALWPEEPPTDQPLRPEILLENVEAERARKRAADSASPLCDLRNRIFDASVAAGTREQGFFSLTVPTGGGKTLSAMAFALAHAKEHGLRRVIVVIPYLSIIEQNAAEYRRVLGKETVIENHSAVEPKADVTEAEKNGLDLISENWDAPVIVTTSVQFLESLFAASPSRCRKLHRIARSVVIFDEVQTLPSHLLQPIFSVFRELQKSYRVTFVFSSATQPAFRRSPSLPEGFASNELHEIAPEPPELFRHLRRVRYHLPKTDRSSRLAVSCTASCRDASSSLRRELGPPRGSTMGAFVSLTFARPAPHSSFGGDVSSTSPRFNPTYSRSFARQTNLSRHFHPIGRSGSRCGFSHCLACDGAARLHCSGRRPV
jgi:CRISPR-associated endonuclease/helicase Cas3